VSYRLERKGTNRLSCAHARRHTHRGHPRPIEGIREYECIDFVSEQWDQALSRLKTFVED